VAQNVVDFNASDAWVGYMNVFDLPGDGGGYQFGSSWEVAALKSTADVGANTLTLQPNFSTYEENPGDEFGLTLIQKWVTKTWKLLLTWSQVTRITEKI
jgi:hypothetical protein